MPDAIFQNPLSGASLLAALTLLWWRMKRAEDDIAKLTDRFNDFVGR